MENIWPLFNIGISDVEKGPGNAFSDLVDDIKLLSVMICQDDQNK